MDCVEVDDGWEVVDVGVLEVVFGEGVLVYVGEVFVGDVVEVGGD